MAAYMAPRSSCSSNGIHRELERRRKLAVVAKGGTTEKSSRDFVKTSSERPAPPCSASIVSRPPARQATPLPAADITFGTTVRVRTRVGTLRTGRGLVLWLCAVVASAAEDGYLEVVYKGSFPRDNPFQTVRVPRSQVRTMPPASTVRHASPVRSRPTVAGKSLPKRLEEQIRRSTEGMKAAW